MLRQLIREEAGMTMGLAVIMIVLIGVMGAGLLTFVQNDLQTVIEVNQGQKASEAAEAGIQAAKRQLLLNSFPNQYNDTSIPPTFSPDPTNSGWAFDSASAACGDLPSAPGKCISTAAGNTRVTIRYLPPPVNASGSGSRTDSRYAPEDLPPGASDYTDKRDYFRVEAEGYYNGARRKIQAIFVSGDLDLPKAYRATKDITLGSSATTINNVSLFAGGKIKNLRDDTLRGTDSAYGNWVQPGYNDKARLASSGTPTANNPRATGAAAEDIIEYDPTVYDVAQKAAPADASDRYKRVDFDKAPTLGGVPPLTNPTPNYRFCARGSPSCWPSDTPQPADVITYPFKRNAKFDDKLLQSLAEEQVRPGVGSPSERDNYVERPATAGTVTIDESTFYQITPALSSIYVVRFTGSTKGLVEIKPMTGSTSNCPIKGTILVINGDVTTSSGGTKCFDGVISVQDPNNLGTLEYTNIGDFTLNGFVNIEGSMTIRGSTDPILGDDILNQPGFHTLRLWSWRECYNTSCS